MKTCKEKSRDGHVCTLPLGHGGVCAEREGTDNPNGTQTWRTLFTWPPGGVAVPHRPRQG